MTMFKSIRQNMIEQPGLSGVLIPILVFGTYATIMFFLEFTLAKLGLFALGYFVFMIMGITIGFHRYFCHKSFLIKSKWKERFLLWAGSLAGQGTPIFWVTIHRGYHHRKPDTDQDPHSPVHGFWNSFLLWIFRLDGSKVNPKYAVDLFKNKEAVFIHEHYTKIFIIFNAALYLIDPMVFFYFSMMPVLITLISYNITNSLNHTEGIGYKNFDTKDNSRNVVWLWPLVLGECWHNNHHGRPGASHFGSGASGKWWEFDPAGFIIRLYRDGKAEGRA